MLESNIESVNTDMKALVKDAREMFSAAASVSGEKADEMRSRGMRLLDAAVASAQEAQGRAIRAGKDAVACTDCYVKENPWRVIAVAVGAGMLLGAIIARR
jgi:ElaB/YqjD/DUF883 family membrane-anchored ribosome-binding protein